MKEIRFYLIMAILYFLRPDAQSLWSALILTLVLVVSEKYYGT